MAAAILIAAQVRDAAHLVAPLLVVYVASLIVQSLPNFLLRWESTDKLALEAVRIVRMRHHTRHEELRELERELNRRGVRFIALLKAERRHVLREKLGHIEAMASISTESVLCANTQAVQEELSGELLAIDLELQARGAHA
jgi:hypothetical protein